MALTLPGSNQSSSASYLKTLDIDFKATEWIFSYYDRESIEEDKIEGIVVGEGFEFRGTIGRPTKNKSINYISDTFGYDQMKNGTIRIHQFIREGSNNSNSSLGRKSYAEWKAQGMKLHRVLFVLQGEVLTKIIFSPVATKPVGDIVSKNRDLPNFYATITTKKDASGKPEMYSNENGEFYVPDIIKWKPIDSADEAKVVEKIKEVDAVVNKKEEIALPEQVKTTPKILDEDIPF